uniref:Uncharacterized protein n=1 Tax=Myotis myotis TaxID=51298 RepID=A0A7J7Z4F2_MYOMY|nr:hypothetical protein mMyoMyo1_010387 [Myotis myotis]
MDRKVLLQTPLMQKAHALVRIPATVSMRGTTGPILPSAPRAWTKPSSTSHRPSSLTGTHTASSMLLHTVWARTLISSSRYPARELPRPPAIFSRNPKETETQPQLEEHPETRPSTSAPAPSHQDSPALPCVPVPTSSRGSRPAPQNGLHHIRQRPVEFQVHDTSILPPAEMLTAAAQIPPTTEKSEAFCPCVSLSVLLEALQLSSSSEEGDGQ